MRCAGWPSLAPVSPPAISAADDAHYSPPTPRRPPPSPSVLSILASILASSRSALATPVPLESPPPFLCPILARDRITPSPSTSHKPKAKHTSSASKTTPTPTPSASSPRTTGQIADRYVQGDDALWRKTDQWTLYGKSCCTSPATQSLDDDASIGNSSSPSSSKTSDVAVLDVSNLPAGWNNTQNEQSASGKTETYIILSLSICLAIAILAMMMGCMFWRKKRRRRREQQVREDVELKLSRGHDLDGGSEDGEHAKEAVGRMRTWAKATARWKASIRQSARRRRNRRHFNKATRSCSPSLQDVRDSLSIARSSPPSSPRSSISEISHEPSDLSTPKNSETSSSTSNLSRVSQLSILLPPAYNSSHSIENNTQPTRRASPRLDSGLDSPPSNAQIPYEAGFGAHISTDDKAQLVRLENLASAPPEDCSSGDPVPSVSAPQWFDDVDGVVDDGSCPVASSSRFFPLPPPSVKINYPHHLSGNHAYAVRLETLGQPSEPTAYPSSSRDGCSVSAPMIEPSAPSLEEELSPFDGGDVSAPEWPLSDPFDSDYPRSSANNIVHTEVRSPLSSRPLSHNSLSSSDMGRRSEAGELPVYRP